MGEEVERYGCGDIFSNWVLVEELINFQEIFSSVTICKNDYKESLRSYYL